MLQFIDGIRQMSPQELGLLGLEDLAYVKRVSLDGVEAVAVHAADGTEIAVMADREIACALVRQHEMEPVSVH